jgi:osmotically-inducible protein OsmY
MRRFLHLAAFLLLAACAVAPADEKLVEAVRDSFRPHPGLVVDQIRVSCENGVVTLSGLVSTYSEYVQVEQLAKATPGVKQVINLTAIDSQRY